MKHHALTSIAAALLMVIMLSLTTAMPALALDLNPSDYFQLTFDPTAFDKSAAAPGEVFHAVIKGQAACIKDLPLSISEINITSQVIARPTAGGADLVINPEYVINIKPLPNKAGGTFDINQTINLQFPSGAKPGDYRVIGQVTSAKVKVLISIDVTGSFPQETELGAVKCIVSKTATAAAQTTASAATTAAILPPTTVYSSGDGNTTAFPVTMIAIIALLVVVIALLIVIVVLVRQRRGI
jgi:hypothetical protein